MNIDLTKLVTSYTEEIEVSGDVNIPDNMFLGTDVRALRDVKFWGSIIKLCDGEIKVNSKINEGSEFVVILPIKNK